MRNGWIFPRFPLPEWETRRICSSGFPESHQGGYSTAAFFPILEISRRLTISIKQMSGKTSRRRWSAQDTRSVRFQDQRWTCDFGSGLLFGSFSLFERRWTQLPVEPPDGSLSLLVAQPRKKLGAVFDELINEQLILLFLDMDIGSCQVAQESTLPSIGTKPKYERVGPGKGTFQNHPSQQVAPNRISILRNGEKHPAFRCGA